MDFGPFLLLATIEGLLAAAVLSLTAVGLSLVFGVMRIVNVAHGAFYMLGAVLAWFVARSVGSDPWVSFIAAIIVAPLGVAAIAFAADRLILRRLDYEPEGTILATIALLYILEQSVLSVFGPEARPVAAPFSERIALPFVEWANGAFSIYYPWGLSTTSYKLFVIVVAPLILVALGLFLSRTSIGLRLRATQSDAEMATAFGIRTDVVYAGTFAAGTALAALGGVLTVPISQAHYLMGGDPLLLSFIAVIIGGLGSLTGTMIAALVIGLADGILSVFFSPVLAKIVATLSVTLVLIFRPQGLFGHAQP